MCSTAYILVVQDSIPFTQNIVVSDVDHTSEDIDMDALGPNISIQRMVVTDVLEKTKQQGEELKVQFLFCPYLTGLKGHSQELEKSHPGLSLMKYSC